MPAIWEYPPEILTQLLQQPSEKELARRAAAYEKMRTQREERESQWLAEQEKEKNIRADKEAAWLWCRANGNPHKVKSNER